MDFIGKTCPYCKTEFKEEDEIVVCSVCEMPHHKECWIENNGCTTFGCTGTIVGIEQYNDGLNSKLYCKKCGSVYTEGQAFCASCGTKLISQDESFESSTSSISYGQDSSRYGQSNESSMNKDIETFVGKNSWYYNNKFNKLNITNGKASWNWCSALFGAYWYSYRKMYGYAALYALINLVCKILGDLFNFVSIGLWVCSGIFGNYLYMKHAEKHVIEAQSMDASMKENYLENTGGTSVGAVILTIFIIVFLGATLLSSFL